MTFVTRNRSAAWRSAVFAPIALITFMNAALAQEPQHGGKMTIAPSSDLTSLINQVDIGANSVALGMKYLEPLITVDEKGEFVPVLATAWELSPDGLTWTFTIREGVKWHDGTTLTVEDVKWNMEEVWRKVHGSSVLGLVESADVVGGSKVGVKLSKSVSPAVFLTMLAEQATVLCPHCFGDDELRESPQNQMPTGTGPFKVAEYVPGQYVLMKRNEDYWQEGKPYLDEIVWRIITDPNTRAAALQSGEIDLVPMSALPLSEIQAARSDDRFEVSPEGYENYIFHTSLAFNFQRPIMANPDVRRAIAHVVDKQKIVDIVYFGEGSVMNSALPNGTTFQSDDVATYDFDIDKANALLDEAGYPRKADGTRFEVTIVAPPYLRGVFERGGQYLAQALKQIGIESSLQIPEYGAYFQQVYKDRSFDISFFNAVYLLDPCISTTIWYTTDAYNSGGFFRNHSGEALPETDAALETACTASDDAGRAEAFAKFQRLASENLAILNLVQEQRVNTYSKRLHNVGTGSANWFYDSWANVWVDQN